MKMKEFGPQWGVLSAPLDPPMAWIDIRLILTLTANGPVILLQINTDKHFIPAKGRW